MLPTICLSFKFPSASPTSPKNILSPSCMIHSFSSAVSPLGKPFGSVGEFRSVAKFPSFLPPRLFGMSSCVSDRLSPSLLEPGLVPLSFCKTLLVLLSFFLGIPSFVAEPCARSFAESLPALWRFSRNVSPRRLRDGCGSLPAFTLFFVWPKRNFFGITFLSFVDVVAPSGGASVRSTLFFIFSPPAAFHPPRK